MYEFIQRYFESHRKSPLIREIQIGCQIASYKSALDRLNALERKGFIKRAPNKHRGIRVTRRVAEADRAAAEQVAARAGGSGAMDGTLTDGAASGDGAVA